MKRLLTKCRILDPFGPLGYVEDGHILIEDGTILDAGGGPGNTHGVKTVPLDSALVMPGLINGHTHLYSALALGMPWPEDSLDTFRKILEKVWWRLDRALDGDALAASFDAGLLECLRAGVTTVIDHHSSPHQVKGSLRALVDSARQFGMNIGLAYEVSDRNGGGIRDASLGENQDATKEWSTEKEICPLFGLHASFTLEEATLRSVASWLEKHPETGIHIHLSEGPEDGEDARRRGFRSPVERLDRFGLLGPRSLMIHGVHCDEKDLEILRERRVSLIHNPTSNANNRVGLPGLELLEDLGAGLGTDGMQANMLREAREGMLVWSRSREPGQAAPDLLSMLLRNNAAIATELFQRPVGHICEGHAADLACYRYNPRTPMDMANASGHLLFGLDERPVHVMTNGEFRIYEGELKGVDEQGIRSRAREKAKRLWQAMQAF